MTSAHVSPVVRPADLFRDSPLPDGSMTRRLLRHRGFLAGCGGVVILAVAALVGPVLVGDPNAAHYTQQLSPPSWAHWLGTDANGRDMVARTVYGARTSFQAALLVFAITTVIGVGVGVPAGLLGGVWDTVVSRAGDVMLGLPGLVMALAIVGALGPGFTNLVLAMTVTGWAGLARISRSLALGSRHRLDVLAARMAGVGEVRIIGGHILPSVASHCLIAATVGLGQTILGLAGLSFLGLGVQPPTAEWGSMLNEARSDLDAAPWLLLGPGLGLVVAVTSVTVLSDALRDCADVGEVS